MSIDDADDPNSQARQTARDWVLRLAAGEVDDDALAGLRAWRSAKPANNAAFEAERRLFRSLQPLAPAFAADEIGEPAQGNAATRGRRVLAPAVSALVAVAAVWFTVDPLTLLRADRTTAAGEIAELALPDGSLALLNSETAIAVDFDARERRVHLLRGEAWFKVAHDTEHPFIVETAGATARAVGTAYSVRREADAVSLAVTEGVVDFAGEAGESVLVRAGQSAETGDGGPHLSGRKPGDVLAWRSGRIVFENRSLSEVAEELSRYRRGSVFVLGEAASRRVSGVLEVGAIDKGLEGLAAAQGLELTHVTPWIVILR